MIKSMTAFAREESKQDFGAVIWEVRSVNHRYLEPYIRLPEDFRPLESDVRDCLKQHIHRGKLECVMTFNASLDQSCNMSVNPVLIKQLAELCSEVKSKFFSLNDMSALDVMKWPGVLEVPETDIEIVSKTAIQTLQRTLEELVKARSREGEKLADMLSERLQAMQEIVVQVRERMPQILLAVRQRLQARFDELSVQLDNDRLEQEMVLITQKSDVDEELTRLETHLHEVHRILKDTSNKPVGRRLDFLMQELNREANTLCSKSMDAETTKAGIDLKVYIEQMREQVQNIE